MQLMLALAYQKKPQQDLAKIAELRQHAFPSCRARDIAASRTRAKGCTVPQLGKHRAQAILCRLHALVSAPRGATGVAAQKP
jgi:hypothetical protein